MFFNEVKPPCKNKKQTAVCYCSSMNASNREPESKQMLDPLGRAWQKWQRI